MLQHFVIGSKVLQVKAPENKSDHSGYYGMLHLNTSRVPHSDYLNGTVTVVSRCLLLGERSLLNSITGVILAVTGVLLPLLCTC